MAGVEVIRTLAGVNLLLCTIFVVLEYAEEHGIKKFANNPFEACVDILVSRIMHYVFAMILSVFAGPLLLILLIISIFYKLSGILGMRM